MGPTLAIERVVLSEDDKNRNTNKEELVQGNLVFYISPIGRCDKKKVEICQIRIVHPNGKKYPVYHDNNNLDHMMFFIDGGENVGSVFKVNSFEIENDSMNAKVDFVLVDKNTNMEHLFQIQLKDGIADAKNFIGRENPIKLLGLRKKDFGIGNCQNPDE